MWQTVQFSSKTWRVQFGLKFEQEKSNKVTTGLI